MRLPGFVAVRLVRNTLLFWILVHVVALLGGLRELTVPAHAMVVLLVMGLAYFDVRSTHERILWANLGIGPRKLLAVVLVVAGLLEVGYAWAVARFAFAGVSEALF